MSESFATALRAASACRLCALELPLEPRPVFRLGLAVRLLIVGQAPGTRAHAARRPFDDRSGDRLRDWLGIDRLAFYDHPGLGVLPIGLCYQGRDGRGADRAPMKICAPCRTTWSPRPTWAMSCAAVPDCARFVGLRRGMASVAELG